MPRILQKNITNMFVFPMLGRSSRFFSAGYTVPKYKLPLGRNGFFVFDEVIGSFRRYFESDLFILICRADSNDKNFLSDRMHYLGVRRFEIIEYANETAGQAESVELALAKAPEEEELFIFNIDTVLYNFKKDPERIDVAGYLEVFEGEGINWSFVEPSPELSGYALRVVEKDRISNLCSNGLYYFQNVRIFLKALAAQRRKLNNSNVELFVAPLYNELIEGGMKVRYKLLSANAIGFCGVPEEYVALCEDYKLLREN